MKWGYCKSSKTCHQEHSFAHNTLHVSELLLCDGIHFISPSIERSWNILKQSHSETWGCPNGAYSIYIHTYICIHIQESSWVPSKNTSSSTVFKSVAALNHIEPQFSKMLVRFIKNQTGCLKMGYPIPSTGETFLYKYPRIRGSSPTFRPKNLIIVYHNSDPMMVLRLHHVAPIQGYVRSNKVPFHPLFDHDPQFIWWPF